MATRRDYKVRYDSFPLEEFQSYMLSMQLAPGTIISYIAQVRRLLVLTAGGLTQETLEAALAQVPLTTMAIAKSAWRCYATWARLATNEVLPTFDTGSVGPRMFTDDAAAALAVLMRAQPPRHGISRAAFLMLSCADVRFPSDPKAGFDVLIKQEHGRPLRYTTSGLDVRVCANVLYNRATVAPFEVDPAGTAFLAVSPGSDLPITGGTLRNTVRYGHLVLRRHIRAKGDGPTPGTRECYTRAMTPDDPWFEPCDDPMLFVNAFGGAS